MNRATIIVGVLFAVFGLVLIRAFENELFYDPLLNFFKTEHTTQSLPIMEHFKLLGTTFFRYVLNSALSLLILWFLFRSVSILKFSGVLYVLFGIVLGTVFLMLLFFDKEPPHTVVFYVRRFLIQPLFLLILIPAFYIQNRN